MTFKKKVRHIVVSLLRDSVTDFTAALRNAERLHRYELADWLGLKGAFFVTHSHSRPPDWVSFVEPALSSELGAVETASAGAVLFLEQSSRVFALTFGYGRHFIDPNSIESDFGLKVALNTVAPDRLRSVDVRTLTEMTINTRRQTSHSSSMETFGLDIHRDLLRAVTGEPREPSFAKRLTGKDALAMTAEMDLADIPVKCQHMLDAYALDTYREHFGWIDHLREVKDADVVGQLTERLLSALRAGDTRRLHLAPPEPVEWDGLLSFSYSSQSVPRLAYPELEVEDYLGTKKSCDTITVVDLKEDRVTTWSDHDKPDHRWRVYDCIVFETNLGPLRYVLSGGQWFRVDPHFAALVADHLQTIRRAEVELPAARQKEPEAEYNKRAAGQSADLVLLDRRTITIDNLTPIEACDIFSAAKQFIHVKRRSRSATLSHLFAQGMVSAQTFKEEPQFREELRRRIAQTHPNLAAMIPDARPNASEFEVVYAIIVKEGGADLQSLPFFSQIHLMQAAKLLGGLDYRLSCLLIGGGE